MNEISSTIRIRIAFVLSAVNKCLKQNCKQWRIHFIEICANQFQLLVATTNLAWCERCYCCIYYSVSVWMVAITSKKHHKLICAFATMVKWTQIKPCICKWDSKHQNIGRQRFAMPTKNSFAWCTRYVIIISW